MRIRVLLLAALLTSYGCDSHDPLGISRDPLLLEWNTRIPPGLTGYVVGASQRGVLATDGLRVYVTDTDSVVAFDTGTGEELWRVPSPCCLNRTRIYLDDGTLYMAYTDRFFALDPATGREIWAASGFDHVTGLSDQVIDQNRIYAPGLGIITALSRESGVVAWSTVLDPEVPALLHLTDGGDRVCFSMTRYSDPGEVGCLSKSTGEILWRLRSVEIDNPSSATVAEGVLVVGTPGNSEFSSSRAVYGFDLETGQETWRTDLQHRPLQDIVAYDGLAITCLAEERAEQAEFNPPCIGLLAASGTLAWSILLRQGGSDPMLTSGRLYVIDAGDILELDPRTGTILRRIVSEDGEPFVSTPVTAGGRLFALTQTELRSYRLP